MAKNGLHTALLSAILFGVSPVACKAIVGDMPAALLAGLLYLGSGVGLAGVIFWQTTPVLAAFQTLSFRQWVNFIGAIVAGGVAAPLFLAYGIRTGTATEVSLLLNFEAVTTTLLAWIIFHEHVGFRVWVGKLLIIAASALVVLAGKEGISLSVPGLSVLAACLFWGVDNNLTREIESLPAIVLASVKGLSAGVFNVLLSLVVSNGSASALQISGALVIGALSYGASLVLFIHALRQIGTARTSTWFAAGPFIGTLLSVLLLGERPPVEYWLAALIMLSGMFFLYGETHRHPHTHDAIAHGHKHIHDEHHQHEHEDGNGNEPHEHHHSHRVITHSHVHWPDIHHRHSH
jgi:drug/metabolite transporter (DMT)-like permease